MIDQTSIQAFMHRFNRGALIAPTDAAGLTNLPILVDQTKAFVAASQEDRERAMAQTRADVLAAYGRAGADDGSKSFPYAGNGTAVIPVHGMLLNRYNYVSGYATGYNAIRSMLNAAMADPDVSRVVLDVNSFGGQAAGMFELASDIRAARAVKPIYAAVDSYAFSAAYGLASAATKIVMSPSAEAGSIGVVSMHVNMGPALKSFGIEVSFIYAGKHKVDGNPYEALSDESRAMIQSRVDALYGQFVSAVEAGRRKKMDASAARKTEARVFDAEESVSLGLADSIMSADAFLAAFEREGGDPVAIENEEKIDMSINTEKPADAKPETVSAADAAKAERARVGAILGAPEAEGRADLAKHLAMNTDMSAEQAIATLAVSPKTPAKAEGNLLASAMDKIEQPNLGADGDGKDAKKDGDAPAVVANRLIAAWTKATGATLGKPN